MLKKLIGILPGIALLASIGLAGKLIESTTSPWLKVHHFATVEYVIWAIVIGLVISNTIGVHKIFVAGVQTYEFWLKLGIVLLGARFLLADVLRLGGMSLILVAIELALSIYIMMKIGKRFGLSQKLTSLLAIGSSICGVSAIIAAKGAIDAKDEEASTAMLVILLLGAFALVVFPVIGHMLGMSDTTFGMWAGLAVDNTAEAIATGGIYSEAAGRFAVLAKTTRNATIGFVVLGYAWYYAKQGLAKSVEHNVEFLWEKFPKFVLGFLLISVLASCGAFSKVELASVGNLSKWAFLLTFAGVGLQTNVRRLWRQGRGPLIVGALGEFAIAVITLGLVLGADTLFGL